VYDWAYEATCGDARVTAQATRLSISLPMRLWRQAQEQLARPDEGTSAFMARLLREALERRLDERYAAGYRRLPVTDEEDAIASAAARAAVLALEADDDESRPQERG
jgi:hypothetical protein